MISTKKLTCPLKTQEKKTQDVNVFWFIITYIDWQKINISS